VGLGESDKFVSFVFSNEEQGEAHQRAASPAVKGGVKASPCGDACLEERGRVRLAGRDGLRREARRIGRCDIVQEQAKGAAVTADVVALQPDLPAVAVVHGGVGEGVDLTGVGQ